MPLRSSKESIREVVAAMASGGRIFGLSRASRPWRCFGAGGRSVGRERYIAKPDTSVGVTPASYGPKKIKLVSYVATP